MTLSDWLNVTERDVDENVVPELAEDLFKVIALARLAGEMRKLTRNGESCCGGWLIQEKHYDDCPAAEYDRIAAEVAREVE